MDKQDDLLDILENINNDNNKNVDNIDEDIFKIEKENRSLMISGSDLEAQQNNDVLQGNVGSGDINTDMDNWFNGTDSIPSTALNNYVSNDDIKYDYGLSKSILDNFKTANLLGEFINEASQILFDPKSVLSLAEEQEMLEDRVKMAFTIYKELSSLNQRSIMSIKALNIRTSQNSEIDNLKLLLSSIPNDKLKAILNEINNK